MVARALKRLRGSCKRWPPLSHRASGGRWHPALLKRETAQCRVPSWGEQHMNDRSRRSHRTPKEDELQVARLKKFLPPPGWSSHPSHNPRGEGGRERWRRPRPFPEHVEIPRVNHHSWTINGVMTGALKQSGPILTEASEWTAVPGYQGMKERVHRTWFKVMIE